jgi:hypothetical protein
MKVVISLKKNEYFPGEIIYGEIFFKATKAFQITGLSIELTGKTHTVKVFHGRNHHPIQEEVENFLEMNQKFPIMQNSYVEEGPYPFSMQLPINIPFSTEFDKSFLKTDSHKTYIRYEIKVKIASKYMGFLSWDSKEKLCFNVISFVDSRLIPSLGHPLSATKTFQNQHFSLIANLNILKAFYVPGDNISFSANFTNQYSIQIFYKFKLVQKITKITRYYRSPETFSDDNERVVEACGEFQTQFRSVNVDLMIPTYSFITNDVSKILKVQYEVALECSLRLNSDLYLYLDIPVSIVTTII